MKLSALAAAAAALVAAGTAAGSTGATCSASGLSPQLPPQKLPAAVADVRARIVRAAVRCDYAALQRIALEQGRGFRFSFGAETSAAAYWRRLETRRLDKPLARLVKILALPGRHDARFYLWPSAYRETPTAADWNALVRGGVYTRAEVNRMRRGGNVYLGYRVGITPRGDWQFFVAGD